MLIPITLIASAINVTSAYYTMKKIHINILNEERLSLAIEYYIKNGTVPLPNEISKNEQILHPFLNKNIKRIEMDADAVKLLDNYTPFYIGAMYMIFNVKGKYHVALRHNSSSIDAINSFCVCYGIPHDKLCNFIEKLQNSGWRTDFSYITSNKNRYNIIDGHI
jgi:hypothetical protein